MEQAFKKAGAISGEKPISFMLKMGQIPALIATLKRQRTNPWSLCGAFWMLAAKNIVRLCGCSNLAEKRAWGKSFATTGFTTTTVYISIIKC